MNRLYRIAICVLVAGFLPVGWGQSAYAKKGDPVKGIDISIIKKPGGLVVPTDKIPSPDKPYRDLTAEGQVEWNFPGAAVREKGVQITPLDGTSPTMMPDGSWAVDSFFDIFYEIELEVNGGPAMPFTGSGTAHMMGTAPAGGGDTRTFDMEMIALDITNPAFMLRESPTVASTGITQITSTPPFPPYRMSSDFTLHLEMSLDGGQTWAQDVSTIPEPASFWLAVLCGLSLCGAVRSRTQRA